MLEMMLELAGDEHAEVFAWVNAKPLQFKIRGAAVAGVAGKLYSFGGTREQIGTEPYEDYNYSKTFSIYDPKTDSYVYPVANITGRNNGYATSVGNNFYVLGGSTNTTPARILHAYNVVTGIWTDYAAVPGLGFVSGLANSDGYLFATVYNTVATVTELYRFDPATPALGWVKMADHAETKLNSGCIIGIPGSIYYMGGRMSGVYTTKAYRYSLASNQWSPLSALPAGFDSVMACSIDGVVYLTRSDGTVPVKLYTYNGVVVNELQPGGTQPQGAVAYGFTNVGKRLYVSGGVTSVPPTGLLNRVVQCKP